MAGLYDALGNYSGEDNSGPGVRSVGGLDVGKPAAGQPPAKASAAPVAGKESIFTGLCDALNQFQLQLVKDKKRKIADQYVIEFAPKALGEATVKRPGDQNQTQAPMQNNNSAEKLDPEKNNVNRTAITWPVTAGTQIIQLIDNVLRTSSYITDQQIVQISPTADPKTGVQKQTPSPGTGKPLSWFKINVVAEPLGVDDIINDFAYRLTYIVSAYQPGQVISQYFPDSKYRGVHKSYQYWFTGNNTQILSYEQKYDNAYRIALSGIGADTQKKLKLDFRDQNRKIYVAMSDNQAAGAKDYTNEPGNNAASFLYDPKSLSTVKMRIIGDPAWLQQGECGLGVSAKTFNFSPFTPDGSINFDAQSVMFDVSFNQPVDYDFNTGIMNTNTMNRQGLPQEHYTFTAVECKSFFSKGRFEQELTGKLVTDEIKASAKGTAGTGRSIAGTIGAAVSALGSRLGAIPQSQADAQDLENGSGTTQSDIADTEQEDPPSPQPANEPGDPTSSGDIDFNAGLAGSPEDAGVNTPPQEIAKDDA
jgi:hypothetical protein